jgi:lipopolysaccharide transport system permease protein
MAKVQVVIHKSQHSSTDFASLLRDLVRDVIGSRHVAREIMFRDLISQYRTSVSGILIPLLPALSTAGWAILFRDAHLINVGTINMPYPFFVLCGMMLWAAFLESMDAPISGLQSEIGLLSKANIPPEAVTIARLGQVVLNFGLKALLIAIAAVCYRVHVPWTIIFAPLGLAVIIALGTAIGLILAPINLLYSDVAKAIPIVTVFWFFTTPIIFTSPSGGWAAILMGKINPMTPLLTTTRELAFGGGLSMLPGFELATACSLGLLLSGALFHRIAMPIVIDRANA